LNASFESGVITISHQDGIRIGSLEVTEAAVRGSAETTLRLAIDLGDPSVAAAGQEWTLTLDNTPHPFMLTLSDVDDVNDVAREIAALAAPTEFAVSQGSSNDSLRVTHGSAFTPSFTVNGTSAGVIEHSVAFDLSEAKAGSAWTLLHPEYAVVVPQPDPFRVPQAYFTARGDQQFLNFVNDWIELKSRDNTIDTLYDYWILGRDEKSQKPRWSIVRDVLHWVD
jgi:hypothetical protein